VDKPASGRSSAFKELDHIPQFKATAKLGEFPEARFSQSFESAEQCCLLPIPSAIPDTKIEFVGQRNPAVGRLFGISQTIASEPSSSN